MIDFFAAVAAAFAAAGAAMILNVLTGRRLPRWAVPAAAGAGMLGYAIWAEYSWYERVAAGLPPEVVVATTEQSSAFWRPWSYVWPITTRFVAIDRRATQTHPAVPDQRLTRLLFIARWEPSREVPVLLDCAGSRAANVADGAEFSADGSIGNVDWQARSPNDPILKAACAEV